MIGDLLRRGNNQADAHSMLRIAHAHLTAYEARRTRTQAA